MAYIMYVTDENKIVYIDEERYVRFDKTRENDLILEVDNMHDLAIVRLVSFGLTLYH